MAGLIERGVRFDVSQAQAVARRHVYSRWCSAVLIFAGLGLTLYRIVTGRVFSLEKARTIDPHDVDRDVQRCRWRGRSQGRSA